MADEKEDKKPEPSSTEKPEVTNERPTTVSNMEQIRMSIKNSVKPNATNKDVTELKEEDK